MNIPDNPTPDDFRRLFTVRVGRVIRKWWAREMKRREQQIMWGDHTQAEPRGIINSPPLETRQ